MLLLASGIGVLTAATARADAVVELKTSRVIELRAQDRHEKVPVVSSVALDPTNGLLATAGDDHVVRIWDASRVMSGEWSVVSGSKSRISTQHSPLATLSAHTDWVQAAVFSPDGKVLATAGRDRQIMLWRVSTGQPLRSFSPSVHGISQLAFSPDGSMLAAAGFENRVWVYDATNGRSLWVREAPGPDIRALAFSPDGITAVSAPWRTRPTESGWPRPARARAFVCGTSLPRRRWQCCLPGPARCSHLSSAVPTDWPPAEATT
jgi:WD40 repeat protein